MNLRNLNIKKFYDSDSDDILNSFYVPALSVSIKYQRLAGFFSSTSLAVAARGIAGFVCNNGKMELVCSAKLHKEDVKAILEAKEKPIDLIERYALKDLESMASLEDKFISDHVKALGWMVAKQLLEIKIAIVRDEEKRPLDYFEIEQSGIFHQKVGILHDSSGNIISFSGSDNESASSWLRNIEEFKVFCNWEETQQAYLEADCEKFLKFWNGAAKRVEVIDVPRAVKNKLIEIAPDNMEKLKLNSYYSGREKRKKEIKLWNHQIEAIDKWIKNNKKCIFEMATGTGKTFAALGCLRKLLSEEQKLITIIACPYSHLIQQWFGDLEEFGIEIDTIIADSTNFAWKHNLTDAVRDINNNIANKLLIFTTHDTFGSEDFMHIISIARNCKLFLIGDEVHGMWTEERKKGFTGGYHFRLGLSATPSRWFDPEGTKELLEYFNIKKEEDKYVFSLEDAINTINPATGETYLAPYEYKPYFCELTEDEFLRYARETERLSRLFYSTRDDEEKIKLFDLITIKRQDIVRNAANKYLVFRDILNEIEYLKHCLVYCSPEQLESAREILYNKNIISHTFTQKEKTNPQKEFGGLSERDMLLSEFTDEKFQVLVAIKCLDEGVDVPQAKIGIILSSTGNPRQYIQRRGRLLRRSPGKTKATIYDIITLPALKSRLGNNIMNLEKKILRSQFQRYEEFSKIAINRVDCIKTILEIEKLCKIAE